MSIAWSAKSICQRIARARTVTSPLASGLGCFSGVINRLSLSPQPR